ncbi:cupin domain-containing protein [Haliea sp. E1-2-M8]|uniref:cupin domain-containing protein n=1 Tax=Haliea sp. E1-2-M8 TaxID=3064706 RepID=UPI002728C7B3|nr:cupin domain-containing protein [Haliea sp. E1-2-M8]MDO8861867.1 cupin domain-containing protein [Haliea sp. E1-2-M8]
MLALDRAKFLAQYWQREPLLLRAAVPDFAPPLGAEELAGLAMEPEVESRIAEYRGDPGTAGAWQLEHGPFPASAFDRGHPWTLLVQGVDQLLDEVAALRSLAGFIPGWRLDDIMVSYASDGGGIGPHYDLYDVFLLQGEGERSWRLGQRCDDNTALLPHPELKLLAEFDCQAEYTLQCGDVLYIPPGVAHWGISRGDSTCFSIGFRAPRLADLLSRWVDARLERLPDSLLLRDPGRAPASAAGEISGADIDNARQQALALLTAGDDERWFGELVTETTLEPPAARTLRRLQKGLAAAASTRLAAGARVAWQAADNAILVFANGASASFTALPKEPLCTLCAGDLLPLPADPAVNDMLQFLLQQGALDVD